MVTALAGRAPGAGEVVGPLPVSRFEVGDGLENGADDRLENGSDAGPTTPGKLCRGVGGTDPAARRGYG